MTSLWTHLLRLLLLLGSVPPGLTDSAQSCYVMSTNGPGVVSPTKNCSTNPNQPNSCCRGDDVCGADMTCYFMHPLDGASGYYIAGCTDPTYSNTTVCSQHCTDTGSPDIVYNSVTQLWACCNTPENGLDCSNPSNETFYAPDPQQLFATPTAAETSSVPSTSLMSSTSIALSASSLSSKTPSSLTTALSTATDSSSAAAPTSSGLTTGARAGIGVGAAIAASALLVGAYLLTRRPKYHRVTVNPVSEAHDIPELDPAKLPAAEFDAREFAQLPAVDSDRRQELP